MTQYIELTQMTFWGYHGVMPQEKKVGNTYTVDLKVYFDFTAAMESDDLNDTINYASIYDIVKGEMQISSDLIEHLTWRIVKKVKESFPQITSIDIRLAKKNPPFGGDIKEAAVVLSCEF
ncbi:dihydroneopterin aldolase [Dysgonomonadaceae bacterium PH5-43]|nr:dihydroneopterin aldolase [Dysgonomonadaceae bacterium PH5-43]